MSTLCSCTAADSIPLPSFHAVPVEIIGRDAEVIALFEELIAIEDRIDAIDEASVTIDDESLANHETERLSHRQDETICTIERMLPETAAGVLAAARAAIRLGARDDYWSDGCWLAMMVCGILVRGLDQAGNA